MCYEQKTPPPIFQALRVIFALADNDPLDWVVMIFPYNFRTQSKCMLSVKHVITCCLKLNNISYDKGMYPCYPRGTETIIKWMAFFDFRMTIHPCSFIPWYVADFCYSFLLLQTLPRILLWVCYIFTNEREIWQQKASDKLNLTCFLSI